ncbi:hypothetical protein HDU96_000005 [Phlyctochytrium bullatum]|nr:hypothetical protein HDU96_000005 [Phlyctochytrium bullatum]
MNSVTVYNSVLWYINKTNNNPNILPDTRIELVPINSRGDRGTSLTGALQMINQDRVAAIIGESNSRNTVTMAVAAAVSNVIHCANQASTPQLSNKNDYPTTLRTQSSATLQARGILSVIQSFKRTNIGILTASDEFGSGVTQLLQLYASSYNVSIALVTVYDNSKTNLQEELKTFADGGIQTIVIITQYQIVNIMRAAQQLGMLDGSYWVLSSLGWTETIFPTEADQALLKNITGTWQLQNPIYEDRVLAPDGSNADAVDMRAWWGTMFNSNEADVNPGVSRTYNPLTYVVPATAQTVNFEFRSNCPNDTQLSVASSIPKFYVRVGNGTSPAVYAAGNMCAGEGLRYLEGYSYMFALSTGYMIPQPSDFMHNGVRCAKTLVGLFDYYTKSNRITIEAINNRTLPTLTNNNITQLVNTAALRDQWGNRIVLDANGDQVMDQDIQVYKSVNVSSKKTVVTGIGVGKWSPTSDAVSFGSEPILFLGGKTAPPDPPVIPTIYFNTKKGMRSAFVAITASCSAFTLGLLGYMVAYRKMKIFVASSPVFLALIILGANISYVGIYLFSMYPMTNGSCVVFGWLKYMGFAVVFGALLVKTHRISVIFAGKKNKTIRLSDAVLFGYFSIIVGLWAVLLIIWNVIPSQRPFLQTDTVANVAWNGTVTSFFQTDYCNFRDYNAISNFAVRDPDVIFVMEALVVILTQTTVAVVLFIPKAIEILAGRGNNNTTFQNTGSTGGSHPSSIQPDKRGASAQALPPASDETAALKGAVEEAQCAVRERDARIEELVRALAAERERREEVERGAAAAPVGDTNA